MNCKTCCRISVSIVTALTALVAVILLLYGSVHGTNLGLSQAKTDKLDSFLQAYVSCSDRTNDIANLNDGTDSDYQHVFKKQCKDSQAYFVLFPIFTVIGLFVATVAGLISIHTATAKSSLVWFCIFGGVTAALAVTVIASTNLTTHHVVSRLVPCEGYSNATVTRLQSIGAKCITGSYSINGGGDNKTAFAFIGNVVLIYTGASLAIVCLLLFLFMQPCSRSLGEDETKEDYDQLTQPFQPFQPTSFT